MLPGKSHCQIEKFFKYIELFTRHLNCFPTQLLPDRLLPSASCNVKDFAFDFVKTGHRDGKGPRRNTRAD